MKATKSLQSRELLPSDFAAVARLHDGMGFDYRMPDLADPLFVLKHGVEQDGALVGAAGLRLQAEAYLWLDPTASVALRYRVVLALSRSLAEAAWRVGLDCAIAYLPPGLPRSFTRLLSKLGWSRDRAGWEPWSKPIK